MIRKKAKKKSEIREKAAPQPGGAGKDAIFSLENLQDEILEVLDQNQRPFMLMPRKQARRQNLPLRVVLIAVRNRDNKLYIHQRAASKGSYTGKWGISAAGHVLAGEALEDAALRELKEELDISGVPLKQIASTPPSPETDYSLVTLFLSRPSHLLIHPDPAEIAAGLFVDEDELAAMLRNFPESIAPSLSWAARHNLFR